MSSQSQQVPQQQRCVIHWRSPQEWGSSIFAWAREHGLEDSVTTLDELVSGEDTRNAGTWRMCMLPCVERRIS